MLKELQHSFLDSILGAQSHMQANMRLGASKIQPEQTWAIYQRNYLEGHIAALADTYTIVGKVVGAAYFRQLARSYVLQASSHSGDLNDYAGDFAQFLTRLLPGVPHGDTLAYLPDIARLDWASFEMLRAAHSTNVWLAQLRTISPSDWPALIATPACRYLRSDYPIYQIWQLSEGSGHVASDAVIRLDTPETVLITRRDAVEISLLNCAEAAFIQDWFNQKTLGAALASACAIDKQFDPTNLLQTLARLGAVDTIHLQESQTC